jgi:hypothetical protein
MLADGTLDGFIANLLEAKLRLIGAVEGEMPPSSMTFTRSSARWALRCCWKKSWSRRPARFARASRR